MRPVHPRLTVWRKSSSGLTSCPLARSQATSLRPQRVHKSGTAIGLASLLAGPISRRRDISSLSTRHKLPVSNGAPSYVKSLVDAREDSPEDERIIHRTTGDIHLRDLATSSGTDVSSLCPKYRPSVTRMRMPTVIPRTHVANMSCPYCV